MPEIQISINNKEAVALGSPLIICGNSDYIINFSFDAEWDAFLLKTARFSFTKEGRNLYEDVVFEGAAVKVPVLSDIALVEVGVYSGDLRTTTGARIPCRRSILCGSPVHEDPPADIYNQITQYFNDTEDTIKRAGTAAKDCEEATSKAASATEAAESATSAAAEATEKCNTATEEANLAADNANAVRAGVEAGGYIKSLKELNKGGKFSVWIGTEEEYKAMETPPRDCLCITTDDAVAEAILAGIEGLKGRVDTLEGDVAEHTTALEGLETKSGELLFEGEMPCMGTGSTNWKIEVEVPNLSKYHCIRVNFKYDGSLYDANKKPYAILAREAGQAKFYGGSAGILYPDSGTEPVIIEGRITLSASDSDVVTQAVGDSRSVKDYSQIYAAYITQIIGIY